MLDFMSVSQPMTSIYAGERLIKNFTNTNYKYNITVGYVSMVTVASAGKAPC